MNVVQRADPSERQPFAAAHRASASVLEAPPARVGDRTRLEEHTLLGAPEGRFVGHRHPAPLDDLAVHGGAGRVVPAVLTYAHRLSLPNPNPSAVSSAAVDSVHIPETRR